MFKHKIHLSVPFTLYILYNVGFLFCLLVLRTDQLVIVTNRIGKKISHLQIKVIHEKRDLLKGNAEVIGPKVEMGSKWK